MTDGPLHGVWYLSAYAAVLHFLILSLSAQRVLSNMALTIPTCLCPVPVGDDINCNTTASGGKPISPWTPQNHCRHYYNGPFSLVTIHPGPWVDNSNLHNQLMTSCYWWWDFGTFRCSRRAVWGNCSLIERGFSYCWERVALARRKTWHLMWEPVPLCLFCIAKDWRKWSAFAIKTFIASWPHLLAAIDPS